MMEVEPNDNSQDAFPNSNVVDQNHDNSAPEILNDSAVEIQHDIPGEEVRGILEAIAATGKFWHDWDKLKGMLYFYLKQVVFEYPEAKMTSEQQISSLGETFQELLKRLDDALKSFTEGPPFTLQRLCEIILAAQSIYPNLSKLAFALEKNLYVTSTLTISSDSYQQSSQPRLAMEERENAPVSVHQDEPVSRPTPSISLENGIEPVSVHQDEIMTEVEEAAVDDDDMTIDMETIEEIVRSSEANSTASGGS